MFDVPLYHIKIDNWEAKKKLLLELFSAVEHNITKMKYYDGGSINTDYGQTSCLLYTSPSPRDRTRSRMPSSA